MSNNSDNNALSITAAPILVNAEVAASLLGISRSFFYSLHSSGELGPLPVRLREKSLWRTVELQTWADAGCPPRETWLSLKRPPQPKNTP